MSKPITTEGFTMEEYAEYTHLLDMHRYYSSMVFEDCLKEINFKKAMEDTLRRWEFVTGWTSRQITKTVTVLKARPEAPRITEIMNLDEPLCFDDIVCEKVEQRCACCPLWHITGKPCEKPGSLKYNMLQSWNNGTGFFYPHLFTSILRKLKFGHVLYSYDFEIFLGGW
jgi:hypothetical protein